MNKNIMEALGYTSFYKKQAEELNVYNEDLIPARVIEVHKEQYKIITEHGESPAKLKGSIFYHNSLESIYPTVGDFVLVKYNPLGEDIIYHVLERKSKFSRLDSWNQVEQIVAANFDYVFIMTSLNSDLNIRRVERYLTAAWQSGGTPVIILTKADLCGDATQAKLEIERIAPGVPILAVSSATGIGIVELEQYVQPGKTIVFLGSSGVGKSSLVNALADDEIMKVNTIREDDSKGRHTTTHRQLIILKSGAMIIDTPGMRELGMWDVSEGLDVTFADIEALAKHCKFRDCNHEAEPGCAVKAALERGDLEQERWDNYIKLKKEMRFAESKEKTNLRLQEKAKQKSLSKLQKNFDNGKR